MSEKLCALRKIGGGTLKETVLWTNPNPNTSQSSQTVTLSDSYNDFDYIGFYFKASSSTSAEYLYLTNKDLLNMASGTVGVGGASYFGGYQYVRAVRGNAGTQIVIGGCWQVGGTTQNANLSIITKIVGLK